MNRHSSHNKAWSCQQKSITIDLLFSRCTGPHSNRTLTFDFYSFWALKTFHISLIRGFNVKFDLQTKPAGGLDQQSVSLEKQQGRQSRTCHVMTDVLLLTDRAILKNVLQPLKKWNRMPSEQYQNQTISVEGNMFLFSSLLWRQTAFSCGTTVELKSEKWKVKSLLLFQIGSMLSWLYCR